MVPGVNNTCVVATGVHLRCEVYVPHDVNNDPVGRVRWYRSLDLVTSEDVTDEYMIRDIHESVPVSSGNFTGLYQDLYALSIVNISSSEGGYYWCQILSDQACLSSSPYVYISVNTTSEYTDNDCSIDYQSNPVCALETKATCAILSTSTEVSLPPKATHDYSFTPETPSRLVAPERTHLALSSSSIGDGIYHAPIATTSGSPNFETDIFSTDKNDPDPLIVTIPTVGCVIFLIALIISFAGIYSCQRRTRRRKGEQNVRY